MAAIHRISSGKSRTCFIYETISWWSPFLTHILFNSICASGANLSTSFWGWVRLSEYPLKDRTRAMFAPLLTLDTLRSPARRQWCLVRRLRTYAMRASRRLMSNCQFTICWRGASCNKIALPRRKWMAAAPKWEVLSSDDDENVVKRHILGMPIDVECFKKKLCQLSFNRRFLPLHNKDSYQNQILIYFFSYKSQFLQDS